MEILLRRRPATDGAVLGELFVSGRFEMFTLEGQLVEIPPGRYALRLTHSNRAEQGSLWTPDPEHRLPLVEHVTGRSGIRIHAGNVKANTDGCILVGYEQGTESLSHSRQALVDLMQQIDTAEHADEAVWLTIESADHPETRTA